MNDDLTPAARVREWERKHGGNAVNLSGWYYFPDGARRENARLGAMVEPPPDPIQRAKLVVRYHEEKLRRATDEFHEAKQQLVWRAEEAVRHAAANTPAPPPTEVEIAELQRLGDVVRACQANLNEARAHVEAAHTPAQRERLREAAANRERYASVLETITNIKV